MILELIQHLHFCVCYGVLVQCPFLFFNLFSKFHNNFVLIESQKHSSLLFTKHIIYSLYFLHTDNRYLKGILDPSQWSFVKISLKHCFSQTIRARELTFLEVIHSPPPVTGHMSSVTCHLSHVTCHVSCVTCHASCVT